MKRNHVDNDDDGDILNKPMSSIPPESATALQSLIVSACSPAP